MNKLSDWIASTVLFSLSVVWTFKSRPNVCYKKYLGPDWKPSYEKAGAKISNHSSFLDICVMMQN